MTTRHEDKRINLTKDQGVLREIVDVFFKFGPDGFRAAERYVFVRSVEKDNPEKVKVLGHSTLGMVHRQWPLSDAAFVCLGNEHLLVEVSVPAALVDWGVSEHKNNSLPDANGSSRQTYHIVSTATSAWGPVMRTLMFHVMQMSLLGNISDPQT